MKKIPFLTIVLTFIIQIHGIAQSCLPNGISFSTQEAIDNFQTNYPNCTEIEGNLWIDGGNITNLDGLSVLTLVGGSLEIDFFNSSLDISGLSSLISIGGDLNFYKNSGLASLHGLENLSSIGRDFNLYECYSLTSLTGLENLTSIGRDLTIMYSNLNNLSGLSKLSSIEGDFIVVQTALTNLSGLNELKYVGGDLRIKGNQFLVDLTGLNELTNIGGDLIIGPYQVNMNNPSLVNLSGLNNLISINGNVKLEDNTSLSSLSGLDSLRFIGGGLWLENNPALMNLNGLNNLDTLWNGIYLIHNEAITSISALEKLTVLGYIWIQYTNNLTSLAGLENVNPEYIYNILLTDNDSLSTCEVKSLCDYLSIPGKEITLLRNAPGCNSITEIEQACEEFGIDELNNISLFKIIPNPASGEILISSNNDSEIVGFDIYNQTGQKVFHNERINQKVDITRLHKGIYIVELTLKKLIIRQKLIVY